MGKAKPKCGQGQSCGYTCIEAADTCRDKVQQDVADALIGAIRASGSRLAKLKSDAVSSFSNPDADKTLSVDQLAAKYKLEGFLGEQPTDLGNGVTKWSVTVKASDGSGDTMSFDLIRHNSKSYTVSDGRLKLVNQAGRGPDWYEAQLAAFRGLKSDSESKSIASPADSKPDGESLPLAMGVRLNRKAPLATDEIPLWASKDADTPGQKAAEAELMAAGLTKSEAEPLSIALKSWLGTGYTKMSPATYNPSFTSTDKEDIVLSMVHQALDKLPSFTGEQLQVARSKQGSSKSKYFEGQKLNRWLKIRDTKVLASLAEQYKSAKTVQEFGMFGTTHLSGAELAWASGTANVAYRIKPKSDGTGKGVAADNYKNKAYEGEVLYRPGTKFRVNRVEAALLTSEEQSSYQAALDKDANSGSPAATNRVQWMKDRGIKPYSTDRDQDYSPDVYDDADVEAVMASLNRNRNLPEQQRFEEATKETGFSPGSLRAISLGNFRTIQDDSGATVYEADPLAYRIPRKLNGPTLIVELEELSDD